MNIEQLQKNMIDQIKEAQIKLGYARETIRLYYPAESLQALLEVPGMEVERIAALLEQEYASGGSVLGRPEFRVHAGRLEVGILPSGVEYVHQQVAEPAFLKDMIALFQKNHHCGIEEIRAVFEGYSSDYTCQKMPEGTDFDYVLYFTDRSIDEYAYCIKEEMGHTIYHRFTQADLRKILE